MTDPTRPLRPLNLQLAALALAGVMLLIAACTSEVTVLDPDATTATSGASTGSGAGATGGTSSAVTGSTGSSGSGNAWQACERSSSCVVAPETCCGDCGQPTPSDMIGVHKDSTDAYKMLACSAAGEDCPGCAKTPDPYLLAYCDLDAAGGTCTAASAHELGVTRCENDSQCALRAGLGCCEACFGDPDALVAINPGLEPELRERVCQGEPLGCPECAVVYPPGAKAVCQGGLCAVSGL